MMSNVGQPTLSNISKTLLTTHREQGFYSTKSIKSLIRVSYSNNSQDNVHNISFTRFRLFQKRYLSTKDDAKSNETNNKSQNESKQGQSFSSESASYRQQARDSYERKRSNCYKQSETEEPSRDNSTSLISSDIDHYQRLNIKQDADIGTIKSAYYSLSKMYHPDIVGLDDKLAAENFRLVTESYDILSDPEKKATYDKELDVASRQDNLSHVFMRSSRHPNKDFNLNYRSRNSDMIFKTMQDAALEREKLKNPNKFRAGVFERSYEYNEEKERLSLSRRLTYFEHKPFTRSKMDGSEFYRAHLFDTIQRRHRDMMVDTKDHISDKSHSHLTDADATTLFFSIGAAFIGIVIMLMSFFDKEPAGFLDDKLVEYTQMKKFESPKTEKPLR